MPGSASVIIAEERGTWFRDGLTSLLLFLLLVEWVRPLSNILQLNNRGIMYLFIAAIAIFVVFNALRIYSWLLWPLNLAICLYVVGYMSSYYQPPAWSWLGRYGTVLVQDVIWFANGQFEEVSLETRSLLFFFGWSLFISMVQLLMLHRQHIVWFWLTTLVYLLVLQYTLDEDTQMGVVRAVSFGLILLALLHLPRLERQAGVMRSGLGWPLLWVAGSVFVAALFIGISWWYSSSDKLKTAAPVEWSMLTQWDLANLPQWMNQHLLGKSTSSAVSLSGYSDDDSRLGGPLKLDDAEVFTARTSQLTYWRGESKGFYDGKGWHVGADERQPLQPIIEASLSSQSSLANDGMEDAAASAGSYVGNDQAVESVGIDLWGKGGLADTMIVQEVVFREGTGFGMMFVGGQIARIESVEDMYNSAGLADKIRWNPLTGNVYFPGRDTRSYRVVVIPSHPHGGALDGKMNVMYTQLPDTLPERVTRLAQEVTAAAAGEPYEQALLLQQYLKSNYAYSLDRATMPGEGEDFVDHFLFVDRFGYCDYFSTAMVVMLRAVGIPARWVKGFVPGNFEPAADDEAMLEVSVSNRDAHSWVEAYFAETGWVTFDPTPGYGLAGVAAGVAEPEVEQISDVFGRQLTEDVQSQAWYEQWLRAARGLWTSALDKIRHPGESVGKGEDDRGSLALLWVWIMAMALLTLASAWLARVMWQARYAIALRWQVFGFRRGSSKERLLAMFDTLWRDVGRKYGAKPPAWSLREYIASLPHLHEQQATVLEHSVRIYEAIRYDREPKARLPRRTVFELWQAIMKPTGLSDQSPLQRIMLRNVQRPTDSSKQSDR